MKSLVESLFDKNIIQKSANLTIRDIYDLNPVYNHKPSGYIIDGDFPIGGMFDKSKLKHYKNPCDNDWFDNAGRCLMGIIIDLPIPPINTINDKSWCELFKDDLIPYIINSRKEEWENVRVSYEYSPDINELTIVLFYQKNSFLYGKTILNYTRK